MSTINTNVPSLVAARVLNTNQSLLNRTLQRLSTGYRINQGADDPAGLIASEALRAEKNAINAAIENASRADKVMSVAEGSLQEVSALLITMEDLVDRSASQSGISDEELAANQLQIDSILTTINRISSTTTFAGKKLLDGTLDYTTSAVATSAIGDLTINSARVANNSYKTVVVNVTTSAQTAELRFTLTSGSGLNGARSISIAGNKGTDYFTFASGTRLSGIKAAINAATGLTGVSAAVSGAVVRMNSTKYGSDQFVTVQALYGNFIATEGSSSTDTGVDAVLTINGQAANAKGLQASLRSASIDLDLTLTAQYGGAQTNVQKTFYVTGGGAKFNISPEVGIAGQVDVGIRSIAPSNLGDTTTGRLSSLGSGQANQLTSRNFQTAQAIVRLAGQQIASLRGRLGSIQQTTLASMMSQLRVTYENVSAAESAIRDTNFAQETSTLTRAQILVQSATSTLQLANAAPQAVLALLRG